MSWQLEPEHRATTQQLAEFVAATKRQDLADDLIELAKRYTLDLIGVASFGATRDWSRIVTSYAKRANGAGPGECTIFSGDWKANPQVAAFVNGTLGHAFELDDVHDESLLHPGTVVVPAALAVAEDMRRSGMDFLVSVVLGYELICRVGLAVGSVSHMLRGFHSTGTNGVFGAAAAAGKLLDASADQLLHALAISASLASGIMEFSQSGGMVKRLHAGRAAEGGVLAAYLAREGLTGPVTALEGKYGFCRSFTEAPEIEQLTDGLGTRYMIREITVKPYSCCSDLHPIIDALTKITERHDIDPAAVNHVLIESTTKLAEQNALDGTTSTMAAQYSAPFTAAATLLRDIRDPETYAEERIGSPEIKALQSKVEVRSNPQFDALYPLLLGARVTVSMAHGKRYTCTIKGAKGSIYNPLTQEEIEQKFRRLTSAVLPAATQEQIIDRVAKLDDAPSVCEVTDLLGRGVPGPSDPSLEPSPGQSSQTQAVRQ